MLLVRNVECRSPRAQVWRLVADTEHLNRFIGNDALDVDTSEPGKKILSQRIGPSLLRYEEPPFEWTEHRGFVFSRVMHQGLARCYRAAYELTDRPGDPGCQVTITIDVTPITPLVHPVVWIFAKRAIDRIVEYVRSVDAELAGAAPIALQVSPARRPAAERIGAALAARHRPALVRRLVAHVCEGDDLDVRRIRPFALAAAWDSPRDDVLRLCLDAVSSGLMELAWGILCPSCRGPVETIPTLAQLTQENHCDLCDLRFGVDLDRVVEASFTPHAAIRVVERRPFCVGGPMLTPHVVAQAAPGPDGTIRIEAPEAEGRYRLFVRGGASAPVEVSRGAEAIVRVAASASALAPAVIAVAPGGAVILEAKPQVSHAKLERAEWAFDAATAHDVSLLPEWRSQFGSQALRPGLALRIAHTALLFSDLCGSTAMYSRVGDAAAFGIVTDCLDYGRAIVVENHGSQVKTMGDAIMAVFADPKDALAAAVSMIQKWESFQRGHALAADLELKIGIFSGPCTIVSANGVLDYFGQTVNSAARVQHLAAPRQVVIPAALAEQVPPPEGTVFSERFEAQVKGIDAPLALVRVDVREATPRPDVAPAQG